MDPALAHRAEQAYLGALLARRTDDGAAGPVQAIDFSDPVHQAVFAALTSKPGSARPGGLTGWLGHLRDLVERAFSRQTRHAARYLAELPGLCPDPANLPAYAAIVTEAGQYRADQARAQQAEQAGREDPVLASAGTWLDGQATRPASRRRRTPEHRDEQPGSGPSPSAQETAEAPAMPARTPTGLAPDTARLARALRADVRRLASPGPDREHRRSRPAPAAPEDLEDRVLASLMNHPAAARAVTRWLPAEAFSTAVRRDLYDLIRQRLASGRPVDPVIIAWDAGHLPETRAASEYGGAAFLAQTALQLGGLDPAPGTGETLGRLLAADATLTRVLGENWNAQPERIRLLAALAAGEPALWPESASPVGAGPAPAGLAPQAEVKTVAETKPAPSPVATAAAEPAHADAIVGTTTAAGSKPSSRRPPSPPRRASRSSRLAEPPAPARPLPAPAPDGPSLRM